MALSKRATKTPQFGMQEVYWQIWRFGESGTTKRMQKR
jgi:hypothetical protein